MNRMIRMSLAPLFGAAAAIASSQTLTAGENLVFSPPKNFAVGYRSSHDNRVMTEYVPDGQTVDDWTQLVTVQIFHGATVDPATFLKGVGARYEGHCPGTSAKGIFTGQSNGYVVSMLLLKCPNNPGTGKPETTAFRVIKGRDALYSVQHAWRAVASDQEVDVAMHALAAVTVCDTRAAEHAWPSASSAAAPGS
jgi:hypothetical protein